MRSHGATATHRRPGGVVGLWPAAAPDLVGVVLVPDEGRRGLALHRRDTLDPVRDVAGIAEDRPMQVTATPDGRWVALAGIASVLHVVDTATGAVRDVDGKAGSSPPCGSPRTAALSWPAGGRRAAAACAPGP